MTSSSLTQRASRARNTKRAKARPFCPMCGKFRYSYRIYRPIVLSNIVLEFREEFSPCGCQRIVGGFTLVDLGLRRITRLEQEVNNVLLRVQSKIQHAIHQA